MREQSANLPLPPSPDEPTLKLEVRIGEDAPFPFPSWSPLTELGERHLADPQGVVPLGSRDRGVVDAVRRSKSCLAVEHAEEASRAAGLER